MQKDLKAISELENNIRRLEIELSIQQRALNQFVARSYPTQEEILQDRDKLYRDLVENISEVFYIIDLDGKPLYTSPSVERLLGYTPEELAEAVIWRYLHPEDVDRARESWQKCLHRGFSQSEYRIRTKRGEYRWVRLANQTRRVQGKVVGLQGVMSDVHERRENDERIRALLDGIPDLMFRLDRNGVILDYRADPAQLHENSANALVGMNNRDHTSREFAALIEDQIEKTLRTGDIQTFEYQLPIKDGTLADFEARMIKSGENEVIAIVRNVTERKKTEKKLAASEAKFRSYVESAPDGIFVIDEKGLCIEVNKAACRMTGYDSEDLIGMRFMNLIDPEDNRAAEEHLATTLTKGNDSCELSIVSKDKSSHCWGVDTVRLSDQQLLVFAKDITKHKQIEEQLRQSAKMQAVGQLAGGIAHDFNNQLLGITGNAELLNEAVKNDPHLQQHTTSILRSVRRAADLTSQLLAFSRKGKKKSVPVDLHRIIHEVVDLLERSIDKKIMIFTDLRANSRVVSGDPTQLQNAILNLGLNARDAMPEGGELRISTETVDVEENPSKRLSDPLEPGKYIKLAVTDTGIGMDGRTAERIFEPFFTTKAQGKGTGMGLAAVYGTIKSHGGGIAVDSKPNEGSTFSVYLPSCSIPEGPSSELPTSSTDGKAYILLVDDEEDVREIVTYMLEGLGYTVFICANGAEAKEFYREHWQSIDLVILDVIMPVMDGEETFFALQEINPDMVVLISSGYGPEEKAQKLLAAGANGFIQKPYRKGVLSQKIAELLASKVESSQA